MTSPEIVEDGAIDPRIDETTALLAAPSTASPTQGQAENGTINNNKDVDEDKPLPKEQIFFLCVARVVEPIAFFSIFPFINQMIRDTGVAEQDVGFYSGLIVRPCLSFCSLTVVSMSLKSQTNTCLYALGIIILFDANVLHDPLGSSVRLLWTQAHPGLVAGGRLFRNSNLWFRRDYLGHDLDPVLRGTFRGNHCVSAPYVTHCVGFLPAKD